MEVRIFPQALLITMKRTKTKYPQHLHNTHLIPPIADREKGIKPIKFDKQDTNNPIVMSDGYKDFYADGTRKTTKPIVYLDEWVKQGSKYATIHRQYMAKNAHRSA